MTLSKLSNGNFKVSGLVFRMSREGVAVPVNCSVDDLVKVGLPKVAPSLHESLDWSSRLSKPGDSFDESLVYFSDGREILRSMDMRFPRADEFASLLSAGGSYQGWLNLAFRYTGKAIVAVLDPDESFSERKIFVPEYVNGVCHFGNPVELRYFDRDFLEFVFGRDAVSLPEVLLGTKVVLSRELSPVMVAGDPVVLRSDQSHSYLCGVRGKNESR